MIGFVGNLTLFVRVEVIARKKGDGYERGAKVISLITLRNRSGFLGGYLRYVISSVPILVTNEKFPSFPFLFFEKDAVVMFLYLIYAEDGKKLRIYKFKMSYI